jgi:hypothetical protein
MTNPREYLLGFLLKKKIPLRLAIDILETALEDILRAKQKKEKAILPKYETRAGG